MRKYDDYAQYPRSALILRVLLLKVRRGGRPQPQARSLVSTWTQCCVGNLACVGLASVGTLQILGITATGEIDPHHDY